MADLPPLIVTMDWATGVATVAIHGGLDSGIRARLAEQLCYRCGDHRQAVHRFDAVFHRRHATTRTDLRKEIACMRAGGPWRGAYGREPARCGWFVNRAVQHSLSEEDLNSSGEKLSRS